MSNPHAQVRFDHTIIPAHDKHRSASFFAEIYFDDPGGNHLEAITTRYDGSELA